MIYVICKKQFFNWRIITSQFCVSAVQHCESAVRVHTSPASELPSQPHIPPLEVPTEPQAPSVSQKRPRAVCFTDGGVYMSVLLSQLVPFSPSPAVCTGLFSMSVSSSPADKFISTIYLVSIYMC